MKSFKTSHESVQKLLSNDLVKENENVDWYEPKIAKFEDFISKTEIWLKRQPDPQSLVDVHDSMSRVSKTSSKTSSVHSARVKIAVDKAGLLARANSLRNMTWKWEGLNYELKWKHYN